MAKTRLDDYLVSEGFAENKSKAQAIILAGLVLVNEVVINKKAHPLSEKDVVRVKDTMPFVSRGGEKLKHALNVFNINVVAKVCIDIGASTGGFTDCLLQNGASFVHALDVGHNQLAYSIRRDERVKVYEKYNARYLKRDDINPIPQIAVTDVSFISVTKIAPAVYEEFEELKAWIVLLKPQFEAEKDEIGKGGIIRDDSVREEIVDRFLSKMEREGFVSKGLTTSPIKGAKGNVEYLLHLHRDEKA